jgi:hypothetical protein
MSKLALLLTIPPLTALAGDAMKRHGQLKSHPNLIKAEKALAAAAADQPASLIRREPRATSIESRAQWS